FALCWYSIIPTVSSVFLRCTADAQYLHSFPTRRSSDLEVGKATAQLVDHLCPGSHAEHRCYLVHKVEGKQIGQIEQNQLFDVRLYHCSARRSLVLTLILSRCFALDCSRFCASCYRRYGSSSFLTARAENSLKACVMTSTSRPLKKTRYRGGCSELSFLSAKSIPYFLAVRSKALILPSVTSILLIAA